MSDLDRIKRNVQKMVGMGAPESDIDAYISQEGVTIDQVRNHKPQAAQNDNRISVFGVTPGSGDAEAAIKSFGVTPDDPNLGQTLRRAAGAREQTERGLIGAGAGFTDFGQGVKQKALNVAEAGQGVLNLIGGPQVIEPGASDEYTARVNAERAAYEQTPIAQSTAGIVGRAAGNTAPYLAMPLGRVDSLPQLLSKSTAFGGGAGLLQFAPTNTLAENMGNAATGAAYGFGVPLALKSAMGGVNKVANSLVGNFDDGVDDLLRLGKQHDVPVFADDASQNPMLKKVTSYTDEIPLIGTRGKRYEQMLAAENSAKKIAQQFGLANSDDTGRVIQKSLNDKFGKIKDRKNVLYDRVADQADQFGQVPVSNMNKAADNVISFESGKPEAWVNSDLVKQIDKYRTNPNMKFSELQILRSQIGQRINDLSTGKAPVNVQGEIDALKAVKRGLETDMKDFALNTNPQIRKSWLRADKYYSKIYKPLKDDKQLQKWMKSGEPDRVFDYYIKRGYKDRARNFYRTLNDDGRQAVKSEIINRAIEKATQQEGKVFRPSRYASEIEKYNDAADVFFRKTEKQYMLGHKKLMGHIERAGSVFDNPMTGQRNAQLLLAGGAGGLYALNPALAAKAAGTVYLSKVLLTSDAGKRILLASSKAKPGSPKMQRIMKDVRELMIKASDAALSQSDPEVQTQAQQQ